MVTTDTGTASAAGGASGAGVAYPKPGTAAAAPYKPAGANDRYADLQVSEGKLDSKTKIWAAVGAVVALLLFGLLCWFLYSLGGPDQAALERIRDIAIIFIVLLGVVAVLLLAGVSAALAFLVFQTKDRVIPLLDETTETVRRARGTVEFMSEEAVRPVVGMAGRAAKVSAMANAVFGRKK